jgi:hypothetical protein
MDKPIKDHWMSEFLQHERDNNHAFIYMMDDYDLNTRICSNEDDNAEDFLDEINQWFQKSRDSWVVQPKYGDVVQIQSLQYRNDGLFFVSFDHDNHFLNIIPAGHKSFIDEYGYVPREFDVPSFSVRYYEHVLAHNSITWVRHYKERDITENMAWGTPPIFKEDSPATKQPCVFSFFEYGSKKRRIWIVGVSEYENEDPCLHFRTTMNAFKNRKIYTAEDDIIVMEPNTHEEYLALPKYSYYHFNDPVNGWHQDVERVNTEFGEKSSDENDPYAYEVLFLWMSNLDNK